MAIPSDRDLRTLGPWPAGANNLALETSVPRVSFRRAVNVDVTDDGKIVRRPGYVQVIDADEPSNLFGYGNRGFFQLAQSLYGFEIVDGLPTSPVELATGLRPDARLAHVLIDPDIFVSDGALTLRVSPTNATTEWTLPRAEAPTLSDAAGSLDPGKYAVGVAFKNTAGEEGPLSFFAEVESSGGIAVSLPALPPGLRYAVYMTKPNGTEMLHVGTVPANTLTINKQRLGRPSPTEDTDPLPPGEFAALWNGRLLTASANTVWWSEPMQYGLTKLGYNYALFAEDVTMLAAMETAEGFFVGQASRTYFMRGTNPNDASQHEVYPAGVIPGTLAYVNGARLPMDAPPTELVPMWLATNGVFCAGLPSGLVVPLTETRYATQHAPEGAALYDQRAGKNKYVATLKNPSENNFALSDSFTAEVIRNGIEETP